MTFEEQLEAARIAAFASNATLNSRAEWIYWLNEVMERTHCRGQCKYRRVELHDQLLMRCEVCHHVW